MTDPSEPESGTRAASAPSQPASRSLAIAALCIGTAIALGLSELVVRLALPPPALYQGHPANVPGLVSAEPMRGYSWTPDFDGRMASIDFDNRYVISPQGLRDDIVSDADQRRRILAVGDSFTGGEGVEADETWPKRLQAALNEQVPAAEQVRVINAGVTGYGARQMRQAAEAWVPVFQPDQVIIGIYPHGADRVNNPFTLFGEHLVRQKEVPNMQERPDGYIWYHSNFRSRWLSGLDVWMQRNLYFGAYLLRLVDRGSDILGLGADSTKKDPPSVASRLEPVFDELSLLQGYLVPRDIGLTVLVISGQGPNGQFTDDTKAMARGVEEFCDLSGITAINPLPLLETEANGKPVFRFPNDGHWTPPAHELAAAILAERLAASTE